MNNVFDSLYKVGPHVPSVELHADRRSQLGFPPLSTYQQAPLPPPFYSKYLFHGKGYLWTR